MLTVVIPTNNSAGALPALLAALVPAAVDGLVREVIVADAGSTDQTLAICEDVGAAVTGSLAEAAGRAKSEWVLVLPVEIRLKPGWDGALGAHLARGLRPAVLHGEREGWLSAPKTGWLAPREVLARSDNLAALKRAVRGARL